MSRKSLNVEIRVGESISIDNGHILVTLQEKSGQRARLHFDADQSVRVDPLRTKAADLAKKGITTAK